MDVVCLLLGHWNAGGKNINQQCRDLHRDGADRHPWELTDVEWTMTEIQGGSAGALSAQVPLCHVAVELKFQAAMGRKAEYTANKE